MSDRKGLDIYAWAPTATEPRDSGYLYPGALLLGRSR